MHSRLNTSLYKPVSINTPPPFRIGHSFDAPLPVCHHPSIDILLLGSQSLRVDIIRPLAALLNDPPKVCNIQAPGYPHAGSPRLKQPDDRPSRLRAVLGLLERSLGDHLDLEALWTTGSLGALGVEVVEEDLMFAAREDRGNRQRIV